jgi:meiotic recombination protein SPO11
MRCAQHATGGDIPDSSNFTVLIITRHWVIARVEGMLERIVDCLLEESDALTITLQSRAGLSRRHAKDIIKDRQTPQPKKRDINFPGATAQEAWNFS